MSDTRLFFVLALSAALLGTACGSEGTAPLVTETDPATQLIKSSGDQQAWYFDNALPAPYAVTALDENDLPVPGVVVTWSVTSGGGSVDPPQAATDANGQARATHMLGPVAMSQSVTASVPGLPTVTFDAMATVPATAAAVTVGNNFFSPRDVTVKIGSTVEWTWDSQGEFHNVTYTVGPSPLPQSSTSQDAGVHSNTYGAAAAYRYVCTIHAGMEGTVTVVR